MKTNYIPKSLLIKKLYSEDIIVKYIIVDFVAIASYSYDKMINNQEIKCIIISQ